MIMVSINVLKNAPIEGVKEEKAKAILFFKEDLVDWFWMYKPDKEIHFSVSGEEFICESTERHLKIFEQIHMKYDNTSQA